MAIEIPSAGPADAAHDVGPHGGASTSSVGLERDFHQTAEHMGTDVTQTGSAAEDPSLREAQQAQAAWSQPDKEVAPATPQNSESLDRGSPRADPGVSLFKPSATISGDEQLSSKLAEMDPDGAAGMRNRLEFGNKTILDQHSELQKAVDAGAKPGATEEERLTAISSRSAQGHIYDAVNNLRKSVRGATTPDEVDKAISEYGKQASMVGGNMGKTLFGAKTLAVRQSSLGISRRNLYVAIGGGVGISTIAGVVPSAISASNSGKNHDNNGNDGKQG